MHIFQGVVLATVLCLFDCASSYVISKPNEYTKHLDMIKREQFTCNTPQRRAISAKEIAQYEDELPKNVKIFPEMTVLHRCESSGCCKGNKTCSAQTDEEVPLTFLVVFGAVVKHIEITATNHTSCSCQMNQKANIK
ncbi:uncharacterized protein [Leptinotarsa decemlineata]|uniref:uncharacterized protein n=1 Tax=Leptinotarsa decemlineata TaxID=7539 RepID=UPI000C251CDB|nr:uncharacterized protein LOC111512543 [Leptinotarsa decemlineata]